jgi:hypothetical protein
VTLASLFFGWFFFIIMIFKNKRSRCNWHWHPCCFFNFHLSLSIRPAAVRF